MIDRAAAADLLQRLVRIPSVNPRGDNAPAESEIASFVRGWMEMQGIPARLEEVLPGRPNVIATLEGVDTSRELLLEAHLDTVEVAGMLEDPFSGRIDGSRLYGRGACDTKGSLASFMLAIADLQKRGIKPPVSVTLAGTMDEEHLFRGVNQLIKSRGPFFAAIVGEPTDLALVVAHKGMVRYQVSTLGKAAHSSTPWEGDNAIERMAEVIGFIKRELEPETGQKRHPLVGPATLCISLIRGGTAINVVPEHCTIDIDRRTLPGEDPEAVWNEHKARLESFMPGHLVVEEPLLLDPAMETDQNSPIVRALADEVRKAGREARIAGVNYGTDGSKIALQGTDTVVFGPGSIQQAHSALEYIELDEVVEAAKIVAGLLERFDGVASLP
ncbi:MAG: M20 family metallopeptidase [Chloroflexota bacterium]|jgi:acetylornithine deacetylase